MTNTKMRHRIVSLLLTFAMMLTMLPVGALAETTDTDSTDTETYTLTIDSSGITGAGIVDAAAYMDITADKYSGITGSDTVTITITTSAGYAFLGKLDVEITGATSPGAGSEGHGGAYFTNLCYECDFRVSEFTADTTVKLTGTLVQCVHLYGITVSDKIYDGEPLTFTADPMLRTGNGTIDSVSDEDFTYAWYNESDRSGVYSWWWSGWGRKPTPLESAPTDPGRYVLEVTVTLPEEYGGYEFIYCYDVLIEEIEETETSIDVYAPYDIKIFYLNDDADDFVSSILSSCIIDGLPDGDTGEDLRAQLKTTLYYDEDEHEHEHGDEIEVESIDTSVEGLYTIEITGPETYNGMDVGRKVAEGDDPESHLDWIDVWVCPPLEITGISVEDKVYDGQPVTVSGAAIVTCGSEPIERSHCYVDFEWYRVESNGDRTLLGETAPSEVGSYVYVVTLSKEYLELESERISFDHEVSAEYPVTISAAASSQTFTVTLEATEGGTVTGAGTYDEGTEVTITATPSEGYNFVEWSDGDTNATRKITVTEDVALTATFEEASSAEVELNPGAPETTIDPDEFSDAVLTEEDKSNMEDGAAVKSKLVVTKLEETSVPDLDKTAIKGKAAEALGDGAKIEYLDLSIVKTTTKNGSSTETEVHETNEKITITMDIPDSMEDVAAANICLIRYHDGSAVIIIPISCENGQLVFQSDKFSTYALAYIPTEESAEEYTITLDANGGTVGSEELTTVGGKLTSLPTPTREDYTFAGWFTGKTGGTEVTTSTVFTADATIYAHWTADNTGSSGSSSGGGGDGGAGIAIAGAAAIVGTVIVAGNVIQKYAPTVKTLVDVHESDLYYNSIKLVYESHMMDALSGYLFRPNAKMKCSDLAEALNTLSGSSYTDNTLAAKENVTRERLALALYSYAQYKGWDTSAQADLSAVPGMNEITPEYMTAVQWAVANGFLTVQDDGRLNPQASITRAETADALRMFVEKYEPEFFAKKK